MQTRIRNFFVGALALLVSLAWMGCDQDITIPAGTHCLKTGQPTQIVLADSITLAPRCTIPAGQIIALVGDTDNFSVERCRCPDRPAYRTEWRDPHGTPVPANDQHAVEEVRIEETALTDTCVTLDEDIVLGNDETGSAPTTMVAFSLKSEETLSLTCANQTMLVDFFVTGGEEQEPGSISYTRRGSQKAGTVELGSLPVIFSVTLEVTQQDEQGETVAQQSMSMDGLSVEFAGTEGTFARNE